MLLVQQGQRIVVFQGASGVSAERAQLQLSDVPTTGARNHTDVQEDLRRNHRHREQTAKPAQPSRSGQIRCQSSGGREIKTWNGKISSFLWIERCFRFPGEETPSPLTPPFSGDLKGTLVWLALYEKSDPNKRKSPQGVEYRFLACARVVSWSNSLQQRIVNFFYVGSVTGVVGGLDRFGSSRLYLVLESQFHVCAKKQPE